MEKFTWQVCYQVSPNSKDSCKVAFFHKCFDRSQPNGVKSNYQPLEGNYTWHHFIFKISKRTPQDFLIWGFRGYKVWSFWGFKGLMIRGLWVRDLKIQSFRALEEERSGATDDELRVRKRPAIWVMNEIEIRKSTEEKVRKRRAVFLLSIGSSKEEWEEGERVISVSVDWVGKESKTERGELFLFLINQYSRPLDEWLNPTFRNRTCKCPSLWWGKDAYKYFSYICII